MDQFTGKIVKPAPPTAPNLDHKQAMESAQKLATFGVVTLLPGHGPLWEGDLDETLAGETT